MAALFENTGKRDAAEILEQACNVRTAAKAVQGATPTLLLDKLGERLTFARTGTRRYETLVSKCEAFGSFEGGPSKAGLEHVCNVPMQRPLSLDEEAHRSVA